MVDIVSSVGQLFDATIQATYAGIPVRVLSSDDEIGRRIVRVLFPGQDDPRFFDLGQDDGLIKMTMLVIGDDHIHQTQRLRTAFAKSGPVTLVHPWLGSLRVVLEGKARITDAVDKMRCTRIELAVWRYVARTPPPGNTLSNLLDQVTDLRAQALSYIGSVLAPVQQALTVLSTVASFASQLGGYFDILVGSTPATGTIAAAAAAPVAALDDVGGIPAGSSYGGDVAAVLVAPSAAIAATSTPALPSAIGPGDAAVAAIATDPRTTAGLLLQVLPSIQMAGAAGWPAPALAAALQATVLADTVSAASAIDFTSDADAATWRDQVGAALDDAADAAAALASRSGVSVPSGALWSAVLDLQATWSADMNAAIGRLPAVVALTLPQPAPAWLIAYYLAGDDPGGVVATLQDLVQRNGIRRPWLVQGPLEVLQP